MSGRGGPPQPERSRTPGDPAERRLRPISPTAWGSKGGRRVAIAPFMNPGHERWATSPGFRRRAGGGPMLDTGPCTVTALVSLAGPVAEKAAFTTIPLAERPILSEPRRSVMRVAGPTHVAGTLRVAGGALVRPSMGFDVAGHRHSPIEVYGTEGSILAPDPNRFDGAVQALRKGGEWEERPPLAPYSEGNHRSIGLADMAHAIQSGRPHRADGRMALHVLEVMDAFGTASDRRATVAITTGVDRPAPLADDLRDGLLAQ